jgi:hypothetical protein
VVRGPSARDILTLSWEYPVFTEVAAEGEAGRTQAKSARRALSPEEAFAYIAGDDPRPLLVLRECFVCNGTDDALLSSGVDNEKTFLFSQWFHCVKLPPDVLQDDHPFRNLFPGGTSEHLFMATRDGSQRIPLESERSRSELWGAMVEVLSADYRSDPNRTVKQIQSVLDDLDALDLKVAELQTRMDELLETEGRSSRKLAKVRKQLGVARDKRTALLSEVSKAAALELKNRTAAEQSDKPSAG